MTKDIIEHNGSIYQIVDIRDEYGQITIALMKDGRRLHSYLITIADELEGDHQFETGESLVPAVIQVITDDIKQGKFDSI